MQILLSNVKYGIDKRTSAGIKIVVLIKEHVRLWTVVDLYKISINIEFHIKSFPGALFTFSIIIPFKITNNLTFQRNCKFR